VKLELDMSVPYSTGGALTPYLGGCVDECVGELSLYGGQFC